MASGKGKRGMRYGWLGYAQVIFSFFVISSAFARPLGGDFKLEDPAGRTVQLSEFRGKVVVLAFGYTHCPDVCPTELLQFAQLLRELGADSGHVQAIFISVDPARDTPEVLTRYVNAFSREILPLTGTQTELKKVARQYGTYFRYVKAGAGSSGYAVDHSGNTYVIDTRGQLGAIYPFGAPLEEIVNAVRSRLPNRD